jgi:hypothetical protein
LGAYVGSARIFAVMYAPAPAADGPELSAIIALMAADAAAVDETVVRELGPAAIPDGFQGGPTGANHAAVADAMPSRSLLPTPTLSFLSGSAAVQESGQTLLLLPTVTPAPPTQQARAFVAPPPSAGVFTASVSAAGLDTTAAVHANPAAGCSIAAPPDALGLDPFYGKFCSVYGLPVIASAGVPDLALQRAWQTVVMMLDGIAQAEEIRQAISANGVRIVIMSVHQVTTDIPEYRELYTTFPGIDWNTRTRGIGATAEIPVLAVGEENVLCYANDQWFGQNLLVHEFAHAIKNLGLDVIDPGFHTELARIYRHALDAGLWAGTYAASDVEEYWAEGVRVYFRQDGGPNAPGGQRYPADTRAELEEYDRELFNLIASVFGDREPVVRCP